MCTEADLAVEAMIRAQRVRFRLRTPSLARKSGHEGLTGWVACGWSTRLMARAFISGLPNWGHLEIANVRRNEVVSGW